VLEFVLLKILMPIFSLLLQMNIGSKYCLSASLITNNRYRSISNFFFFWDFNAFNDRTVERDRKQGRERGNDTQQGPSGLGLNPGPTVARTIASVCEASA